MSPVVCDPAKLRLPNRRVRLLGGARSTTNELETMKRKLLQTLTVCAACLAWAAQGQNSTSPDSTGTSGTQSTGSQTDSSASSQPGSSQWQGRLSATGRTGHHELRGSKLMGADVKTSSGESLGKIEDVVVNPSSGRIDFAVISYSGSTDSSGAARLPTPLTSTTSSSGEKLVPLPWSMIRSAGGAYGGTPASTEQPSFVFNGDKSRLQSAPSFDRNSWPDFSQSDWSQRIYSAFGSSATGGASSPGGTSSGESSTGTADPSSGTPSSPPSTPDSNSSTPK